MPRQRRTVRDPGPLGDRGRLLAELLAECRATMRALFPGLVKLALEDPHAVHGFPWRAAARKAVDRAEGRLPPRRGSEAA